MLRYIRSLKGTLACMALGAMLAGCSADDIDTPRDTTPSVAADTQLVINLAVPTEMATAPGSRADVPDSGDPSMTPTAAEATVRNLRLVLYNPNNGKFYNRSLLAPDEMPVSPDRTAMYEISDIDEGSYKVYLFANLADDIDGIESMSALEAKRTQYGSDGRALTAGNLPMVYEGTAAITVKGKNEAQAAPMVNASLRFACAKVRMNLVFDKSNPDVQSMFGETGIMLKSLTLKNLSKEGRVLYTTAYSYGVASAPLALTEGAFYTAFTETQANASVNDKWVLNVSGTGSKTLSGPALAKTWVWQADFYVPERYLNNGAQPTQLYIEAASTTAAGAQSNITMNYTINLGKVDGNDDDLNIYRGKLYEVIGKFKSYNNGEITTNVIAREWEPNQIDVDMVATYLKLAKTTASVTSLDDDQVGFDTDSKCVPDFEVETPTISGKQPIVMKAENNVLTFSVNADINLTTLSAADEKLLKGTATCYVTVGNIRKQLLIDYDITPFFIIKPLDQKIQYEGDIIQAEKSYTYKTNLGGLIIGKGNYSSVIVGPSKDTGTTTTGSSTIEYRVDQDLSEPSGMLYVKAVSNPGTTTVHNLTAYPVSVRSNKYNDLAQPLSVTVLPPLPNYRLYFRAINDYMDMSIYPNYDKPEYATASEYLNGNYSLYRTEGGDWNWADWWTPNVTGNTPNTDHHRVYIYTQMGETTSSADEAKMTAWVFTDGYGSSDRNDSYMTADYSNPGWYYFDQPKSDPKTKWYIDKDVTKNPEPGKTLVIFYNNNDRADLGYALHRMSHHNDPGITLFDFEDREGYYIYDPTMEPYYRMYDERPKVIDAEYIVYSKSQITSWEHSYGIANNQTQYENPRLFTVKYTFKSSDGFRTEVDINGTKWQKTTIKLKALAEDKSKAITLNGLRRTTLQPQYAYYSYSSDGGFDKPNIYIFRGNGGTGNEVKAWPGEPMGGEDHEPYLVDIYGDKIYRYEIPPGYENGTVVFSNPNNDQDKSADLALGGQSKITFSEYLPRPNDSSSIGLWYAYGDQPGNTVVLNDGNDFTGNGPKFEVTFDGNNWYQGQPRN